MEEGNIKLGEAKHLVRTSGLVQLSYKTSQYEAFYNFSRKLLQDMKYRIKV